MRFFLIVLGLAAIAVAIGFASYGINFMYDNSYMNKVVGGDAYNFIIYATRGTAFVCAGVVAALTGVFFMLWSSQFSQK